MAYKEEGKSKWEELDMQFKLYREQGPDEEVTSLDEYRKSPFKTESMERRDALRRQAIEAASKIGKGYRQFETPNLPDNFGVPMTDGFGYC